MRKIVKILKQDGSSVNIKDGGEGLHNSNSGEMPPFYSDLTDYKFVKTKDIDPKSVIVYGDAYDSTLRQGSHATGIRTNDRLEGRIDHEGFDAAKLPLVIYVDGKPMALAGHSRINWAISEKVVSMPMYVVEDPSNYGRRNVLTNHLKDNAIRDITEKVTKSSWIESGKEIIDFKGQFVPGKPNSEDTIDEWLEDSGATSNYSRNAKNGGGLAAIRKALLHYMEKGGPKAMGIHPTSKEEQDLRQEILNTGFADSEESHTLNREYVTVNVTSFGGNTTIHQAMKVLDALGRQQSKNKRYEIVVVLSSAEERDIDKIYKNRYHIAQELVSDANHLIKCVNAFAETQISERDWGQAQKHIKFAVMCNLTVEQESTTNAFDQEWAIRDVDLMTLQGEAQSRRNKKAA